MPDAVRLYEFGLDGMIDELDRIGAPPSYVVVGKLESVLRSQFLDTQARTHVITGSLKLSGRTSSDFDGTDWTGEIHYGGPSAGPNNPVDYAIYEMARGGDHDFFGGLDNFHDDYRDAILFHYRSLRG